MVGQVSGWRRWVGAALLALGLGFCTLAWVVTGLGWLRGEVAREALAFAMAVGVLVALSAGALAWGIWRRRFLVALGLLVAGYASLILCYFGVIILALVLNPPELTVPLQCAAAPGLLLGLLLGRSRRR